MFILKTVNVDTLQSIARLKRKDYNKEFKKLKNGDRSADTIHNARVAGRRLNAMLKALSIISNSNINTKKLQKKVKKTRKKLGGTRDIQITRNFLVNNQEKINNFNFDSFEKYYQQVQQKSLKKTDKFINEFKIKKTNKKLKRSIKSCFKNYNTQISLHSLFKRISSEKENLLAEFELLNRNDKSTFHQLRKDLKKMRYTLEILNEIDIGNYNIDNYKDFQDRLGEIQDIEVIRNIISTKFHKKDGENNLKNLNTFLNYQQNELINNVINKKEIFLEMMNQL